MNTTQKRIDVNPPGYIELIDWMPRNDFGDTAIVEAARVSTGAESKGEDKDRQLIDYLMRNRHTSPFEMVEFKFRIAMPIFTARQWVRHRTASLNEYSGRYTEMPDLFFIPNPEDIRMQNVSGNKQAGDKPLDKYASRRAVEIIEHQVSMARRSYEQLIQMGVAREQARMILPLNQMTYWVWKQDLHNLLHFLNLRLDPHAQAEIRVYAEAILQLITPIVPWTIESWNRHTRSSL